MYAPQDATVLSEGTRPGGEGACRSYNFFLTYASVHDFFLSFLHISEICCTFARRKVLFLFMAALCLVVYIFLLLRPN